MQLINRKKLSDVTNLEESHDKVLKSIEQFQNHQERVLSEILSLDRKIDSIIEQKNDE
jgi:hypothetical protein